MGRKIHLVSCVGQKATEPRRAEDLYVSDWFRKARRYVKEQDGSWYILSAKYGLLEPSETIEPYEATLKRMRVIERRAWTVHVLKRLQQVLRSDDAVVVLEGQAYREFLVPELERLGYSVSIPMEGLTIGRQLKWLKERIP